MLLLLPLCTRQRVQWANRTFTHSFPQTFDPRNTLTTLSPVVQGVHRDFIREGVQTCMFCSQGHWILNPDSIQNLVDYGTINLADYGTIKTQVSDITTTIFSNFFSRICLYWTLKFLQIRGKYICLPRGL